MRHATVVLGLLLVIVMTTGYSECAHRGRHATAETEACDGPCKVVSHFNDECEPVSPAGEPRNSVRIRPRQSVCFVNNTECTIRLNFPDPLFGDEEVEVTLAPGECERLIVDRQAAHKKISYTIACSSPCVRDGGSGNPDFNVGGGGGGGGGGGDGDD
jgi:hypothetical protein